MADETIVIAVEECAAPTVIEVAEGALWQPGDAIIYTPDEPVILLPDPVLPPATYALPGGATQVSTTAQLLTAWASGTAQDIVLADGIYEHTGPLPNSIVPHRLWAATLLGAEVRFGLSWGGNTSGSAGELHGIAFNVSSKTKCTSIGVAEKAIVMTWMDPDGGFAGGLIVEDCTFDMNSIVGSAIQATCPFGFEVRRVQIRNGIDWGIMAHRNNVAGDALPTAMIMEDIDIDGIRYPVPELSDGGIGVWIGHEAIVTRCKIRNVDWAGVALVNDATGCRLYDIDVDTCFTGYLLPGGSGIKFEQCHDVILDRYYAGPEMMVGISAEWNSDNINPCLNSWIPRNHSIWVSNVTSYAYKIGVSWDLTVQRCQIRHAVFYRSWRAAILDNNQFLPPTHACTFYTTNCTHISTCRFVLAEGVASLLYGHHLTYLAPPPPGWPATPAEYDDEVLGVRERGWAEAVLSYL